MASSVHYMMNADIQSFASISITCVKLMCEYCLYRLQEEIITYSIRNQILNMFMLFQCKLIFEMIDVADHWNISQLSSIIIKIIKICNNFQQSF